MGVRDLFFVAGLLAALLFNGFPGAYWAGAGLAAALFLGQIRYVYAGRWQAAPLAGLAIVVLAVQLFFGAGGVPLVLTLVLAALILLSAALLILSPVPNLPTPKGTHAVGLRRIEVEGGRKLLAYVWHPAQPEKKSRPRCYHSKVEAQALSAGFKRAGAPGFLNDHLRLARTHAYNNAPVADGRFPMLVFNHGGALYPTQNFSLMEELASQGYVCISVGHPGESAGLVWKNGDVTLIEPGVLADMKGSEAFLTDTISYFIDRNPETRSASFAKLASHADNGLSRLSAQWAEDSMNIVDALLADEGLEGAGGLRPVLDETRLAYAGMSLGGATAMLCCHIDERAAAGVNLDGANWCFDKVDEPLRVPFLQLYGDPNLMIAAASRQLGRKVDPIGLSSDTPMHNDPFFSKAEHPTFRLIFPNIGHMAFTDNAISARYGLRTLMGLGKAASPQFCAEMNALVVRFLDGVFEGDDFTALEQHLEVCEGTGVLIRQTNEAA